MLKELLLLAAVLGSACRAAAQDPEPTVLDGFPILLRAGLMSAQDPSAPEDKVLADLPFNPQQGFGYVGGTPGRRIGAAAFHGSPAWPLAWRDGVEKYVFRVPQGDYVVELTFLETEVAARGLRVFDVLAEERKLFPEVDIAGEAGDFAWLTLRGLVPVNDGWLDLKFVPAEGSKPPRVSRIRITRRPTASVPPRPQLDVEAGVGAALLRWSIPPEAVVSGYALLRSDSTSGPFEPILRGPVHAASFIDAAVAPGQEYFYKVCAQGLDGAQGECSEARSLKARAVHELGLRVYDLRILEEELRRLSVRGDPPADVPAEVHSMGEIQHVLVSRDTDLRRWQRKKSYSFLPQTERNRRIFRRKSLYFSAEAGDPTLLRQKVTADAASALGLAVPAVEPVVLLLNGVYQGVYFDIEPMDRRFRERTRLDRAGVLAFETRGDSLAADWLPYGEQRGEEGNIMGLTELVQELNLLGNGEFSQFFEDTFYADRYLSRMALRVVRGADSEGRYLLKDSRNGKWEVLEDRAPNGSFGVRDFELEGAPLNDAGIRRTLYARSQQGGPGARGGASVLETRFWSEPNLRDRLFARVEEILAGPLSAEKFDAIVDQAFARIREAAILDPWRWPQGSGDRFLSGPSRLKDDYRERAGVLRGALAAERTRPPPPLQLSELAALPSEGEARAAIRNASAAPVSLDGWHWTASFQPDAERTPLSPGGMLAPGDTLVLKGGAGGASPASSTGGYLGLWRDEGGGEAPRLRDSLFYGHQTKSLSYARLPSGRWTFLGEGSSGAAEGSRALAPPPYEYRQGVVKEKNGDARIWFQTRPRESAGENRPEKVALKYREEGSGEFQSVDLQWDDKAFRHSITLGAAPERKRTAYYFVAASSDGVEQVYPLPAPRLTFFLPVLPEVKINEVLPRPGRKADGPGEFIEIYNATDQPVDLDGFFLSDSTRNPTRWRIPQGSVVAPKKFIVFYADGVGRGSHASFKLSNSGEFLGLFGRMEEGNLQVDGMAFRGLRTGESWGASPDGTKNFRAWKDPTPGGRNIPKIPEEYLKKKREERAAEEKAATELRPPEPLPSEKDGENK